mgnify:CR=1 FL=1
MARKKKKIDTWKTKKWYTIVAPPSFNEKELGETPASNPERLIGRSINVTLAELTEKRAQQYVGLKFKITEVKGEKALTSIQGHELQRGYVGRQTRRMKTLITVIFKIVTKDGKKLQVQVIAFGKERSDKAQEKNIRKMIIEAVEKKAKKTTFEKLFQEIVFGKLSAELFAEVKKVFPLTRVEVTKTKVLEGSK